MQRVVRRQFIQANTTGDELLCRSQSDTVGIPVVVCSHDAHSVRIGVVVGRVRPHTVPASSLVRISVLTDKEIVTNISPTVRIHVVVLNPPHHTHTRILGGAG